MPDLSADFVSQTTRVPPSCCSLAEGYGGCESFHPFVQVCSYAKALSVGERGNGFYRFHRVSRRDFTDAATRNHSTLCCIPVFYDTGKRAGNCSFYVAFSANDEGDAVLPGDWLRL